jgi:hypothetical protein
MKKRSIAIAITLLTMAVLLPVVGYYSLFARPYPADPEAAVISFEDLTRFANTHREAAGSATVYQRQYFDLGSRPVGVWESRFEINATALAEHVAEEPALYEDFDARVTALSSTEPDIRQAYAELKRRYPEAVFSPLYVFFGAYSVRALIRPFGVLFGGEYFTGMPAAMDPNSPHYLNGLMAEPDTIVSQAIHEQAHIQQARHSPLAMFTSTVLDRAIYEGTADYVSELVTGGHNNPTALRYVNRHGEALWCRFYRSTDLRYRDYWIDAEQYGRPPAGINGAFGYYIAEAYYEAFDDPAAGFKALLELNEDYDEIFRKSGLHGRLSKLCS